MRVLTLQEPWASLIGEGIKTIETRSWPCNQFGELYIHAGSTKISSKESRTKPRCYLCGDYTPGRYAWILSDIELIEPIQKSGKLGIWYYNEDSSKT